MRHLDLFSGIGGFAYAVDQVWNNAEHIFCDNDPFCREVLKRHWPGSSIYDDIKSIADTSSLRWRTRPGKKLEQETQEWCKSVNQDQRSERVDILTGGFPCQPFSTAGLRRGTADERHLWPEMLRVIRLTQPDWVIAENVRGLLTWNGGLVFEQVCSDLEAAGYEVQPFIIPAVAVNAPHQRDRIWFVANTPNYQRDAGLGLERQPIEENTESGKPSGYAADTQSQRQSPKQEAGDRYARRQNRMGIGTTRGNRFNPNSWNRNWPEVAAELCSVDDGLPVELGGLKLSKPAHRSAQLKAYGNAIVPAVAVQIFEAIRLAERI